MYRSFAFLLALLFAGGASASAASVPLTPISAGFHQYLKCNQGYVTVDVAPADPKFAPGAMLVTTALAAGQHLSKSKSVRSVDAQGNIYQLGFMLDGPAFKKFPKALLLPASPPAPGERNSTLNIAGAAVEKRFDGPRATVDVNGRAASGYAFSDFVQNHKINTVTYVPNIGITEARFYGILENNADMVCRIHPSPG